MEGNPPKTLKIAPKTGKGNKDIGLHSHFSPVPGSESRVRCKACYKAWMGNWLQQTCGDLQKEGRLLLLPTVLREVVPPANLVPSFNKAGTNTLRSHLMKEHGAEIESGPEKKQIAIAASFCKGVTSLEEKEMKVALALAFNPSMTFRMLNNDWFMQAFGKPADREKNAQSHYAN